MGNWKEIGFLKEKMYEFPNIVNVEVYRGDCPCSCFHCPVGKTEKAERKERFREKGISIDLYRKIVDEMINYKSALRIHSVGEPLLWENLAEAVKYGRGKVNSWIFTCGITKDKKILEELCENVNIIEVSVNSVEGGDYKETKGVNSFHLVHENIEHMGRFIKSRGLKTRLIASRVQSLDKEKDDDFVKYWKGTGLVGDSFIRSYHTYNELLVDKFRNAVSKHQPCLVHWARFNINAEGKAVICFNELFKEKLEPEMILGDVNNENIESIWKGWKLNAIRKAELSGDYKGLDFEKNLPCKICTSCQPLFGNRETSEHQINEIGEKTEDGK